MKKITIMATLIAGLFAFSACNSDRDDNPVLKSPTTFTMNKPLFANSNLDLAITDSIDLKVAEQPAYGFPTAVVYGAQMSLENKWTDTDIYTFDASTNALTLKLGGKDIDKAIMILGSYKNSSSVDPNIPKKIYLRMTARPVNLDSTQTIYSNVQELSVYPYYLELRDAEPEFWWLIGGSIGDGTWTNTGYDAKTQSSVFPMSLINEYSYDKATGTGLIQSTFYMPDDGSCKLIYSLGSWNAQWGVSDGAFVKNDGGSGNIAPTDGAGYYTLAYDTKADIVTLTKSEKDNYPVYSTISCIGSGSFGSWDQDFAMNPAVGQGDHNHMWTLQINITEASEFKFRANNDWGTNWGYKNGAGKMNYYGWGGANEDNLIIEPGNYTIYFNDIDGFFRIVPITE